MTDDAEALKYLRRIIGQHKKLDGMLKRSVTKSWDVEEALGKRGTEYYAKLVDLIKEADEKFNN